MIFVGIDDTDVIDSPGTNKLARHLIGHLVSDYTVHLAIRHQLLFDRRIPYTSKNSSASILLEPHRECSIASLAERLRELMNEWFVEGSDPGLCIATEVPAEIMAFGHRCQKEIVTQREAIQLAAGHGIHLESIGGTGDGVIGALAAIGLAAEGNDGRVVSLGHWDDDLCGPQSVDFLRTRGVHEVRCLPSGELLQNGTIDIGKHLRPNYRRGRVVLFVEPAADHGAGGAAWRAVRFT